MKVTVFWPILGHKSNFRFLAKTRQIRPKNAKKLKISKIQKTSFVCILKCHFHAKNGLQWVNWKRVEAFRSKFSDPQNPRISYTFREKIAKYCRLWQGISRHQIFFFNSVKSICFPIIQIWKYVQMRNFFFFGQTPPPPTPLNQRSGNSKKTDSWNACQPR